VEIDGKRKHHGKTKGRIAVITGAIHWFVAANLFFLGLIVTFLVTGLELRSNARWRGWAHICRFKLYPLLLMCLNPTLERVTFVFEFVRYGVSRCVEYRQKDFSSLKELGRENGTPRRAPFWPAREARRDGRLHRRGGQVYIAARATNQNERPTKGIEIWLKP
jgi:hypothetical protein